LKELAHVKCGYLPWAGFARLYTVLFVIAFHNRSLYDATTIGIVNSPLKASG